MTYIEVVHKGEQSNMTSYREKICEEEGQGQNWPVFHSETIEYNTSSAPISCSEDKANVWY